MIENPAVAQGEPMQQHLEESLARYRAVVAQYEELLVELQHEDRNTYCLCEYQKRPKGSCVHCRIQALEVATEPAELEPLPRQGALPLADLGAFVLVAARAERVLRGRAWHPKVLSLLGKPYEGMLAAAVEAGLLRRVGSSRFRLASSVWGTINRGSSYENDFSRLCALAKGRDYVPEDDSRAPAEEAPKKQEAPAKAEPEEAEAPTCRTCSEVLSEEDREVGDGYCEECSGNTDYCSVCDDRFDRDSWCRHLQDANVDAAFDGGGPWGCGSERGLEGHLPYLHNLLAAMGRGWARLLALALRTGDYSFGTYGPMLGPENVSCYLRGEGWGSPLTEVVYDNLEKTALGVTWLLSLEPPDRRNSPTLRPTLDAELATAEAVEDWLAALREPPGDEEQERWCAEGGR